MTTDSLVAERVNSDNFNDYNSLLTEASEKWGLEPTQLEDYMNRIAFHESGGVADRLQGNEGPGRGLFQFETGLNQGGHTAANRLKYELGYSPEWLNITDEGVDASSMSPEQQRMLFLANYLQKPGKSSGMSGITEDNLSDWWLENHWARDEKDKEARRKSFEGNMNVYGL